jgi:uncharacterized protein with GYD domain
MPKFLVRGSYTAEGTRGLIAEGATSRRATVTQLIESLGGNVESFYYGFGDDDVYVVVDAPSNAEVTAISLAVAASGAVKLKTTVLMTPEEVEQAAKLTVPYRAPGT